VWIDGSTATQRARSEGEVSERARECRARESERVQSARERESEWGCGGLYGSPRRGRARREPGAGGALLSRSRARPRYLNLRAFWTFEFRGGRRGRHIAWSQARLLVGCQRERGCALKILLFIARSMLDS
jgi:hypothetical protein